MPKRPQLKKLDQYGIVDTGASNPSVGEDGELFYNTTDGQLNIWISGAWSAIGTASDISGGLDNLLLTNDDNFLLTSDSGEDVLLLTSA